MLQAQGRVLEALSSIFQSRIGRAMGDSDFLKNKALFSFCYYVLCIATLCFSLLCLSGMFPEGCVLELDEA